MKATCHTKCYWKEQLFEVGQEIDLADGEDSEDMVVSYFTVKGKKPAVVEEPAPAEEEAEAQPAKRGRWGKS